MNYRPLGNTGVTVSEIGVGCGGLGAERKLDLEPSLEWAFDNGVTLYDTAESYAEGRSEEILGKVFARRRDRVVLATKFGGARQPDGTVKKDFSRAHMREALETSLRRLGTDYIDVYQLHNPRMTVLEDGELFEELDRLVEAGKIRCYGLSIDDAESANRFLDETGGRVIQILYNLTSQKPRTGFIETGAPRREAGVIIKVPLSGGLLSGKFTPDYPPADDPRRRRWGEESFAARLALVEKVRPILEASGRTMAQGALAWLLSHEAISTVIPGVSSLEKVQDNVAAAGMRLNSDEMAALDAIPELQDIHLGW